MVEALKGVDRTEYRREKRRKQNKQMSKEHQAFEAIYESLEM